MQETKSGRPGGHSTTPNVQGTATKAAPGGSLASEVEEVTPAKAVNREGIKNLVAFTLLALLGPEGARAAIRKHHKGLAEKKRAGGDARVLSFPPAGVHHDPREKAPDTRPDRRPGSQAQKRIGRKRRTL